MQIILTHENTYIYIFQLKFCSTEHNLLIFLTNYPNNYRITWNFSSDVYISVTVKASPVQASRAATSLVRYHKYTSYTLSG